MNGQGGGLFYPIQNISGNKYIKSIRKAMTTGNSRRMSVQHRSVSNQKIIALLLPLLSLPLLFCPDAEALSSGNVAGIYNATETATVTITADGETETAVFYGANDDVVITQNGSQFSFTLTDPSSGISVTRTGTVTGNTISNITGPIIVFRPTSGFVVNQNVITYSSGQIYSDRFTLHVEGYATGTYYGYAWRADVVSDSVFYSKAPLVTTGAAGSITATTATLGGNVNPQGYAATVWFEYGLTTAYGSTASAAPSPLYGYTTQPVSVALSGLQAGKTYHYRVAATSSQGTSYGNDATFTLNKSLSLDISGSGGGSVYGTIAQNSVLNCMYPPQHGTCSTSLAGTQTVNLTAVLDSNSVIGGWGSQCGSCSGLSCTLTVDENKNCEIIFTEADRVRINTTPYLTLTSAFAHANLGEVWARAIDFSENPTVTLPTDLKGGFNVDFSNNSGNYSTLRGTLTIGTGCLTMEGLIIAP